MDGEAPFSRLVKMSHLKHNVVNLAQAKSFLFGIHIRTWSFKELMSTQ